MLYCLVLICVWKLNINPSVPDKRYVSKRDFFPSPSPKSLFQEAFLNPSWAGKGRKLGTVLQVKEYCFSGKESKDDDEYWKQAMILKLSSLSKPNQNASSLAHEERPRLPRHRLLKVTFCGFYYSSLNSNWMQAISLSRSNYNLGSYYVLRLSILYCALAYHITVVYSTYINNLRKECVSFHNQFNYKVNKNTIKLLTKNTKYFNG